MVNDERSPEQRLEDYTEFTEMIEVIKDYLRVEEDFVVKRLNDIINYKDRNMVISADGKGGVMYNKIIPKARQEIIKWCILRYNSLKRKAINAGDNDGRQET